MKVIDLTLTISEQIPTFLGSPQPNFISWETLEKDGYNLELLFLSSHTGTHIDADGYNLELLFLSSHTGTHIDAPYHFLKKGQKIHQIVTRRLVTEAILIKIRKVANQSITKDDIQKFEKKYGKIDDGSTVIFHTGWQKNLKKESYFLKNPGLAVSAAKYLASKKVNMVGIDSPSIDLGKDSKFSVHHILKLKNATGSPVRAMALTD